MAYKIISKILSRIRSRIINHLKQITVRKIIAAKETRTHTSHADMYTSSWPKNTFMNNTRAHSPVLQRCCVITTWLGHHRQLPGLTNSQIKQDANRSNRRSQPGARAITGTVPLAYGGTHRIRAAVRRRRNENS